MQRHQTAAVLFFVAGAIFLGLWFAPGKRAIYLPLGALFLVLGATQALRGRGERR